MYGYTCSQVLIFEFVYKKKFLLFVVLTVLFVREFFLYECLVFQSHDKCTDILHINYFFVSAYHEHGLFWYLFCPVYVHNVKTVSCYFPK